MGEQRAVPLVEVVRALDPGGDLLRPVVPVPTIHPVRVRRFPTGVEQCLVDRRDPGPGESVVVVELGHLPRRARVRECLRIRSGVERRDRDLVGHHVVRVGVAAVLVVGGHHLRPELAHDPDQGLGRHLQRLPAEAPFRQRGQRVPLGQTGVHEAEPLLEDAQRLGGGCHLPAAEARHVPQHLRVVLQARVEDVPPLTAGAGDHEHLHPFGGVLGHRGRALAGLVVGVGVHGHQPQFMCTGH